MTTDTSEGKVLFTRWRIDRQDVGEATQDVGERDVGETTRWRNDWIPDVSVIQDNVCSVPGGEGGYFQLGGGVRLNKAKRQKDLTHNFSISVPGSP